MGGIAIDPQAWRHQFLPDMSHKLTYLDKYTVKAAVQMCPALLESITESHIMDKSKSNALAKTLVCMQALWFMAQCISRLAQILPISLLEVSGEQTLSSSFH